MDFPPSQWLLQTYIVDNAGCASVKSVQGTRGNHVAHTGCKRWLSRCYGDKLHEDEHMRRLLTSNEILHYGVHHKWLPKVKELLEERQRAGQTYNGRPAPRSRCQDGSHKRRASGCRQQATMCRGTSALAGCFSGPRPYGDRCKRRCKDPSALFLRGALCKQCTTPQVRQVTTAIEPPWRGRVLKRQIQGSALQDQLRASGSASFGGLRGFRASGFMVAISDAGSTVLGAARKAGRRYEP